MCGPKHPGCGCSHSEQNANAQYYNSALYAPRFTQAVTMAAPLKGYVAGGYLTPTVLPGQLMAQDGHLGLYEDLYGGVSADGQPAMVAYPGTWGMVHAAGSAR